MTPQPSPDEHGQGAEPEPFAAGTFALFRLPSGNLQLVVRMAGRDEEILFPPAEWGGLPAELLDQAQAMFADVAGGGSPLAAFRKLRTGRRALKALR